MTKALLGVTKALLGVTKALLGVSKALVGEQGRTDHPHGTNMSLLSVTGTNQGSTKIFYQKNIFPFLIWAT